MTRDEITEWALTHGFSQVGDGVLLAPYGEGDVRIAFSERTVKVTAHVGTESQRLASCHHGRVSVDRWGMLSGVGLVSTFAAGVDRGAPVPVWFTPEYREAAGFPALEAVSIPLP